MDIVEIVDSDPAWPLLFDIERRQLLRVLDGEMWLGIEHFGSTAVPGLAAKPIIDILITVPCLDVARHGFVSSLTDFGYVFWADNPRTDRLFFVKGMPPFGDRRTHHIHVAECPSEMSDRLKFRDYLRQHPSERDAYACLKRSLASQFKFDREAYTAAKSEFVARIMNLVAG
ncbi:GrpB family protein [filamentous cyanobacterium LEGE 11480]|uniref:GrpB family protein n=1 Tax=Romeriopsis navalis LEGE 11480 TaxID=2777977 RepID=A0A928VTP8_9CYAN|nr:GrpB family protein [Romeriopsis navalis]MBE9032395.1 GrpB family protein [Romeriopsis navalis LEGE 11480]